VVQRLAGAHTKAVLGVAAHPKVNRGSESRSLPALSLSFFLFVLPRSLHTSLLAFYFFSLTRNCAFITQGLGAITSSLDGTAIFWEGALG
jgi:hypothetical protein